MLSATQTTGCSGIKGLAILRTVALHREDLVRGPAGSWRSADYESEGRTFESFRARQ